MDDRSGSLKVAKSQGRKTAFLCHSHLDVDLAERLQNCLQTNGWKIYIDWKDASLPATPNKETAEAIQKKITELDWFLFLATENSMRSRWCPWELGYADGKRGRDRIAIVPTIDDRGNTYGAEYMALYQRVDINASGKWALIDVGYQYGKELHELG